MASSLYIITKNIKAYACTFVLYGHCLHLYA